MSKSNLTVILNGEQVFCDELIRESARLAIQHEADKLTIEALRQQVQDLERYAKEAEEAGAMCNAVQKEAAMMKAELDAERAAPSYSRTCTLSWRAVTLARCAPRCA